MTRRFLFIEFTLLLIGAVLALLGGLKGVRFDAWIALCTILVAILEVIRRLSLGRESRSSEKGSVDAASSIDDAVHQIEGSLISPKYGENLGRTIKCVGTCHKPGNDFHCWLMVEVDGERWPKEGEVIVRAGRFTHTINEDGNPERFSIGLYITGKLGHQRILRWFDQGRTQDSYPSMGDLTGIRRIARVDGLTLTEEAKLSFRPDPPNAPQP